jgi:GT2 family glycosyltransferase
MVEIGNVEDVDESLLTVKLSIIISTWNSLDHIGNCLDSIFGIGLKEFEVIIVDANSNDGTREFLHTMAASDTRIRIRLSDHRIKWSEANQIGLDLAKGEWVCFSNPDIIFNNDFPKMLVDCEKREFSAAVPQLVFPDGSPQRPAKIITPWLFLCTFTRTGRWLSRKLRRFGYLYPHPADSSEPIPVECPQGSLFIVHRRVLERLKGCLWNEGYQNGFSDIDAFLNLKREGFPIWLFPKVKIIHFGSYVTKKYPTWIERDQARGSVLYFRYWQKIGTPRMEGWISPRITSVVFGLEGILTTGLDMVGRMLTRNPFFTPVWSASQAGDRILGLIDGWKYRID